jgi:hypothetical protein
VADGHLLRRIDRVLAQQSPINGSCVTSLRLGLSVGIARCAGRHINKKPVNKKPVRAAKHQGRLGRSAAVEQPRRFREKGGQPFGVTPSRHLLARILAPWRIEHPLYFGKLRIFSAARTTICSQTICSHKRGIRGIAAYMSPRGEQRCTLQNTNCAATRYRIFVFARAGYSRCF